MFGISHLITVSAGKNLTNILIQVTMAVLIGLILALIIYYTNNIYICIGYHFLNNLIVSISDSFGFIDSYVSYAILILLFIYLLVLNKKLKDIYNQIILF